MNVTTRALKLADAALALAKISTNSSDDIRMYNETLTVIREALAEQAEQGPVAWVEVERGIPMFMNFTEDYKPYINNGIASLYAAPVRTKDLTDDEIADIRMSIVAYEPVEWGRVFARAVIAADREKNK